MADDVAVVGGFDGDFRIVHHARLPPFLPARREEETRCGVLTSPPPERPDGRAAGDRNSLRGFSGRSEENRAGASDWYLARGVVDMAGGDSRLRRTAPPRRSRRETVLWGMVQRTGGGGVGGRGGEGQH
jgi:hypothetical protein